MNLRIKRSARAGAAVLTLMFALPLTTLAAEFRSGDQPGVSLGTVISDDLYIAGADVDIFGAVTGDLLGAGGNLFVEGAVGGDATLAGGTVTVTGAIADDLRVAGGDMTIRGTVASDIIAVGGQIRLAGERVGGDVRAVGGSIRIDSPIEGDVRLAGETVMINAPIAGMVDIDAGEIVLGERAVISGDFTYRSPQEARMENGAQVLGHVEYTPQSGRRGVTPEGVFAFVSVWLLGKFLMVLVGALLLGLVFNRYSKEVTMVAFARPVREWFTGLLTVIALPVLSVALLATIVGIPVGILGLLGFVMLLIFSSFLAAILFGSLLHRLIYKPLSYEVSWRTILFGTLAYVLITSIPVIGWVVCLIFLLLSLGAMLRVKWRVAQAWR